MRLAELVQPFFFSFLFNRQKRRLAWLKPIQFYKCLTTPLGKTAHLGPFLLLSLYPLFVSSFKHCCVHVCTHTFHCVLPFFLLSCCLNSGRENRLYTHLDTYPVIWETETFRWFPVSTQISSGKLMKLFGVIRCTRLPCTSSATSPFTL